jgi:vacuolar-type H+-ATPase subunit I/STV1
MDITNGIFAALIAGAVALIVGSIKDRQSKIELYAQTVSNNRMEWIKEMRGYLVKLIVLCRTANSSDRIKFECCRANILMRLNPYSDKDGETEKELRKTLDKIIERIGSIQSVEDAEIIKNLEIIGAELLKKAWERLKIEAGETDKKRDEINCRMEEFEHSKE